MSGRPAAVTEFDARRDCAVTGRAADVDDLDGAGVPVLRGRLAA